MRWKRLGILLAGAALVAASCGKKEEAPVPAPADDHGDAIPLAGEGAYEPDAVTEALSQPPAAVTEAVHEMNARRGRILFATKGCVICHSVNGVGGAAGAPLDAPPGGRTTDPLEFSARIWRGAPAMAALQEIELGYVIELDAQDIADLAAFAASPEEQVLLTYDSIPSPLRDWFINTPYWDGGDWSEFRGRGERIPHMDDPDL